MTSTNERLEFAVAACLLRRRPFGSKAAGGTRKTEPLGGVKRAVQGPARLQKRAALSMTGIVAETRIMRGHVLGVDTRTGQGVVAGDDGLRYRFTPEDWAHRGEPAIGMYIDFEAQENRALSVFPVPGHPVSRQVAAPAPGPSSDRNKYVAAVLAGLVGPLAIHRFYLGRIGSAVVMLVLSLTVVGLLVSVPWAFIDMIRYLVMSDRDFAQRYARASAR